MHRMPWCFITFLFWSPSRPSSFPIPLTAPFHTSLLPPSFSLPHFLPPPLPSSPTSSLPRLIHAQESALQDQRRQMILAKQRIDDDEYAQRLLGKLDDNDDHVQVCLNNGSLYCPDKYDIQFYHSHSVLLIR